MDLADIQKFKNFHLKSETSINQQKNLKQKKKKNVTKVTCKFTNWLIKMADAKIT